MITVFDTGGVLNAPPVITELKLVGEPTQTSAEISYKVSDADLQIVRHFITIPGLYDEKEITKDVGYDKDVYTYKIEGLTKNTTYSVVITCSDGLAKANSEALQIKTKNAILYSFTINEADSNPATRVGYGDEATGVTPATSTGLGGWEDKWPFNVIRIVGLQEGKVIGEISKKDRTQYVDGQPVGRDVDVMTEFPTIYWRKSAPSGQIKFEISDAPIVGGDCYAHNVGGVVRPSIYVGCYLGFLETHEIKFRSWNKTRPMDTVTLTNARTYAHNQGSGYELLNFNILTMLQVIWTLAYKNTNSQSALGMGFTGGDAYTLTGGTDTKGWVYGSQDGRTEQMCFLGIEDLWGNLFQWVDGLYIGNNYEIWLCTDNVHFDGVGTGGAGWENVGVATLKRIDGFASKISVNERTGFFPIKVLGSNTTYYADYCSVVSNYFAGFGGYWGNGVNAGIFCLGVTSAPSSGSSTLGARLVYIGEVTA